MWKCDAGTLISRQGDAPTCILALASGTVGAYTHASRQPAEVYRITHPGACIGAKSVLLGDAPKVSLSAITPVWVLRVPHRALAHVMQHDVSMCERLAYSMSCDSQTNDEDALAQSPSLKMESPHLVSPPEHAQSHQAHRRTHADPSSVRTNTHSPHLVIPQDHNTTHGPFLPVPLSPAKNIASPNNAPDSEYGQIVTVKVSLYGVHSLPTHVPLGFAQCDPTVFLELDGQRAHTASIRYSRQAGTEPQWNEDFIFREVRCGGEMDHGTDISSDGSNNVRLSVTLCEVGPRGGVIGTPIGRGFVRLDDLIECRRFAGDLKLTGRKARKSGMKEERTGHDARVGSKAGFGGGHTREEEHRNAQEMVGLDSGKDQVDNLGGNERLNGGKKSAAGEDSVEVAPGGVLTVDICVEGMYYKGEEEFLSALRLMGCERHYLQLKKVSVCM
jgi:hypothetical protein